MRDRTADLLDANQALSQLSYSPVMVGLGRLALPQPTSPTFLNRERGAL